MRRGQLGIVLVVEMWGMLLGGCGSGASPKSNEAEPGTLRMALTATANGRTYRLRNATFTVSGPTSVVLDSESSPGSPALTATLNVGAYTIALAPPWFLERLDATGPVTVDAMLTSPNPASFSITSGAATAVPFRFSTEGAIVTIGTGTLEVTTEVTETGAAGRLRLLAGKLGGSGSGDGTGATARFSGPVGVDVDGQGNVYVADTANQLVRKVAIATGEVTTVAGMAGVTGSADGVGTDATFSSPLGVALDGAGNLYVTDSGNSTIRKIVLGTAAVTTFAGVAGFFGNADGVGATVAGGARFANPAGITFDGAGNLFVTDAAAFTIRRIAIDTAEVTTVAGRPFFSESVDGMGSTATFAQPQGIASDHAGHLWVLDAQPSLLRRVDLPSAGVTTVAGDNGSGGTADGTGRAAFFERPVGITTDGAGNLYIADTGNCTIRKVTTDAVEVTTPFGIAGICNSFDGHGTSAAFAFPQGIVGDRAGHLYVADTGNATIRAIALEAGDVTTLAGAAPTNGGADGTGGAARFSFSSGVLADGAGNLFMSDSGNNTIRKVVLATGEVTTLAGTPGTFGTTDGTGADARFGEPWGLATDGAGNLYVSDLANATIRKIVIATGEVTTFAGTAGLSGFRDGVGANALFGFPQGMTSDGAGNLYVTEFFNATIRKIVIATGEVTTLAGAGQMYGSADGTGADARFAFGTADVTADHAGNLYYADNGNATIRKIVIATGEVTTLAGTAGVTGSDDGTGAAARFNQPSSINFDGAGNLFVADTQNHTVRKIATATAAVTTVVGTAARAGVLLGPLPARLNQPAALTALPGGELAILDESSVLIARF